MSDPLTIERDTYGKWRVLYKGEIASSAPGAMSWFRRKRDAQSFINWLRFAFGERLNEPDFRMSEREREAFFRALEERGAGT